MGGEAGNITVGRRIIFAGGQQAICCGQIPFPLRSSQMTVVGRVWILRCPNKAGSYPLTTALSLLLLFITTLTAFRNLCCR